jgi:transcriptional regulator with XRE-family HTH domain
LDAKIEEFLSLMKASGWSQAEVARQLHITPGAVSQICTGKIRPRPGTLNMFRLVLKNKNPAMAKKLEKRDATPLKAWEREFVNLLRNMPEADRRRFLAMIQAFAGAGKAT